MAGPVVGILMDKGLSPLKSVVIGHVIIGITYFTLGRILYKNKQFFYLSIITLSLYKSIYLILNLSASIHHSIDLSIYLSNSFYLTIHESI